MDTRMSDSKSFRLKFNKPGTKYRSRKDLLVFMHPIPETMDMHRVEFQIRSAGARESDTTFVSIGTYRH